MKINYGSFIQKIEAFDIRFPTSLEGHGSDALHLDPDYSVCYVVITTSNNVKGYGMTFTLGKGTNIVTTAVNTMKFLVENQPIDCIFGNFGTFWRKLTSESQLRWVSKPYHLDYILTELTVDCVITVRTRKGGCSPCFVGYYQCTLGSLG